MTVSVSLMHCCWKTSDFPREFSGQRRRQVSPFPLQDVLHAKIEQLSSVCIQLGRPTAVSPLPVELFCSLILSSGTTDGFPSQFNSLADFFFGSLQVDPLILFMECGCPKLLKSIFFNFRPLLVLCREYMLQFHQQYWKIFCKSVWGNPAGKIYEDIKNKIPQHFEKRELKN